MKKLLLAGLMAGLIMGNSYAGMFDMLNSAKDLTTTKPNTTISKFVDSGSNNGNVSNLLLGKILDFCYWRTYDLMRYIVTYYYDDTSSWIVEGNIRDHVGKYSDCVDSLLTKKSYENFYIQGDYIRLDSFYNPNFQY